MADKSQKQSFDVAIIGGGPGGYVAAIRAAQLGLNTVVVEENHMGGICLNWGCIPTKALLRSAEVYHLMQNAKEFGLDAKNISFDMKKIVKRSRDVAGQLASGVSGLMKKNKVQVIDGRGSLNGKNTVKVTAKDGTTQNITATSIILATGARARVLPGIEPDGKQILTYKEAMTLENFPESILVIGSGAIGIEFASFYNTLGAKTTVVEVADRVLPVEDEEISKAAKKAFEKQGMTILTAHNVTEVKKGKKSVKVTVKDKKGKETTHDVTCVISAVGIVPNTEGLGLEGTNITFDRGHIVTNGYCQTGEDGVYAIGDVTAAPWLAHKASHEGTLCAEHIAGHGDLHPLAKESIPGCTYCLPQVASVGLTEAQANEKYNNIRVGRFSFVGNGKAIALGEPDGLIKTIFNGDTGEILGAHMIGAEVTELIHSFVLGKTMEATEEDLMRTIFPHPTLSEMIHESTLDAFGKVIHM